MPYSLVFIEDGERAEIKPLCNDNPKSEYGFEDRKIERKGKRMAAILTKDHAGLECFVEYYDA